VRASSRLPPPAAAGEEIKDVEAAVLLLLLLGLLLALAPPATLGRPLVPHGRLEAVKEAFEPIVEAIPPSVRIPAVLLLLGHAPDDLSYARLDQHL